MRLEQLQYLIEIDHRKSLSKASAVLNISHQGLSSAISNLEEELGFAVLKRNSRGVTLTDAGQDLAEASICFLDKLTKIHRKYQQPEEILSHCNIIMNYGILYTFLPMVLHQIYQQFPSVTFTLSTQSLENCVNLLQNRSCNVFFADFLAVDGVIRLFPPSLSFKKFKEHDLCVYAHETFPIAAYDKVSLSNILKYPTIIACHDTEKYSLLPGLGISPCNTIEAQPNMQLVREMVLSGRYISLLVDSPLLDLHLEPTMHVKKIALRNKIKHYCGYVYRDETLFSETEKQLVRLIIDISHYI